MNCMLYAKYFWNLFKIRHAQARQRLIVHYARSSPGSTCTRCSPPKKLRDFFSEICVPPVYQRHLAISNMMYAMDINEVEGITEVIKQELTKTTEELECVKNQLQEIEKKLQENLNIHENSWIFGQNVHYFFVCILFINTGQNKIWYALIKNITSLTSGQSAPPGSAQASGWHPTLLAKNFDTRFFVTFFSKNGRRIISISCAFDPGTTLCDGLLAWQTWKGYPAKWWNNDAVFLGCNFSVSDSGQGLTFFSYNF